MRATFAELVSDDDGLETTEDERELAAGIQDRAFNELFPMIEAAFPEVMWHYPSTVTYEAGDSHGDLLGIVERASPEMWCFKPASPVCKLRVAKYGVPADSLPRWAVRAVKRAGWFGAVLADGSRFPDDYRGTAPALRQAA